jgi:hypothetical protein
VALSTYADLRTAAADWLDRADVAHRIPDFIALAEVRLDRLLRARRMEVEAQIPVAVGARTAALPADFREGLGLWRETPEGRIRLRFVTPGQMPVSSAGGAPERWSIDGANLVFERPCIPGAGFILRMLARLSLSEAQPVNPVLADYPDLYLFGTLVEAAPFLRDAELLSLFAARFEAALMEARAQEARHRAGATLSLEAPLSAAGA